MKRQFVSVIAILTLCATFASAQWNYNTRLSVAEIAQGAIESLVTVSVVREDKAVPVGAGLVVRSDGVIAVAAHLVKDAGEIQVKLRNGEIYDHAQIVATDERRNVAFLRVPVVGLRTQGYSSVEESMVGARMVAVYNVGDKLEAAECLLSAVVLADEIAGAGTGFRVMKINVALPDGASGVLVNERGGVMGLLFAKPQAKTSYAVPTSSLYGQIASLDQQMANRVAVTNTTTGGTYYPSYPRPAASPTPVPIAQNSVSVPERGVLPLDPKGPGSVVVKPATAADVLKISKTMHVRSETTFFKAEQLVNELNKRAELTEWGISCVDDYNVADLVLTIGHIDLTWKFTFTISHQRTGLVVATGDVIVWDGNLGSPKMAKRVVEKLSKVRATAKKPDEKPADKSKDDKSGKKEN